MRRLWWQSIISLLLCLCISGVPNALITVAQAQGGYSLDEGKEKDLRLDLDLNNRSNAVGDRIRSLLVRAENQGVTTFGHFDLAHAIAEENSIEEDLLLLKDELFEFLKKKPIPSAEISNPEEQDENAKVDAKLELIGYYFERVALIGETRANLGLSLASADFNDRFQLAIPMSALLQISGLDILPAEVLDLKTLQDKFDSHGSAIVVDGESLKKAANNPQAKVYLKLGETQIQELEIQAIANRPSDDALFRIHQYLILAQLYQDFAESAYYLGRDVRVPEMPREVSKKLTSLSDMASRFKDKFSFLGSNKTGDLGMKESDARALLPRAISEMTEDEPELAATSWIKKNFVVVKPFKIDEGFGDKDDVTADLSPEQIQKQIIDELQIAERAAFLGNVSQLVQNWPVPFTSQNEESLAKTVTQIVVQAKFLAIQKTAAEWAAKTGIKDIAGTLEQRKSAYSQLLSQAKMRSAARRSVDFANYGQKSDKESYVTRLTKESELAATQLSDLGNQPLDTRYLSQAFEEIVTPRLSPVAQKIFSKTFKGKPDYPTARGRFASQLQTLLQIFQERSSANSAAPDLRKGLSQIDADSLRSWASQIPSPDTQVKSTLDEVLNLGEQLGFLDPTLAPGDTPIFGKLPLNGILKADYERVAKMTLLDAPILTMKVGPKDQELYALLSSPASSREDQLAWIDSALEKRLANSESEIQKIGKARSFCDIITIAANSKVLRSLVESKFPGLAPNEQHLLDFCSPDEKNPGMLRAVSRTYVDQSIPFLYGFMANFVLNTVFKTNSVARVFTGAWRTMMPKMNLLFAPIGMFIVTDLAYEKSDINKAEARDQEMEELYYTGGAQHSLLDYSQVLQARSHLSSVKSKFRWDLAQNAVFLLPGVFKNTASRMMARRAERLEVAELKSLGLDAETFGRGVKELGELKPKTANAGRAIIERLEASNLPDKEARIKRVMELVEKWSNKIDNAEALRRRILRDYAPEFRALDFPEGHSQINLQKIEEHYQAIKDAVEAGQRPASDLDRATRAVHEFEYLLQTHYKLVKPGPLRDVIYRVRKTTASRLGLKAPSKPQALRVRATFENLILGTEMENALSPVQSYYKVLGISRNATYAEIDLAYEAKRMVQMDNGLGSDTSLLDEARDVLKNPAKRMKHNLDLDLGGEE